jgi:MinD superfamily P-loop ATPase
MKQVVFISGKGGTGKSTLVSSLCVLVNNKAIADCDVDAPNLHILLKGKVLKTSDFSGAKEARIDPELCTSCGLCIETCRFDAIADNFEMKPLKCEGCGACVLVCPTNAIHLEDVKTGETYLSETSRGTFAHALLEIGAEASGKLVTAVRRDISSNLKDEEWTLIDGCPGIGCNVIASITGVDAVVAVAEPTKSGRSDLERVLGVARHFQIPAFVCINKHDLNPKITAEIEKYCVENDFPVIGKLAFDPTIVDALRQLQTPVEAGNKAFTAEVSGIWESLVAEIE